MKILIADDKKELAELIKTFLTKKGYAADIALNGQKAQEMLECDDYDIAFIDHDMPEVTGLELVKFIKGNNIKTKAIILTGYPSMKDVLAKSVGADGYITKPCQLEDIQAIVDTHAPGRREAPLPSKKILVVDDEPRIIKLIQMRLQANNYRVITATNGKECLEKIASDRPDLILLDVMMPVMDGYSTLIALKEMKSMDETQPRIPVIMLSARADARIKGLVETEEICGYVTKPFNAERLLTKIKETLEEKKEEQN